VQRIASSAAVSDSALRDQQKEAVELRNSIVFLAENRIFLRKNAKNKAKNPKN
jgi:TfoX/Sxy family transcriptional regulator of competence genes